MSLDPASVWTPVALSADLPPASVLPARLASASLAVWRAQGGAVLAVADRCPHRGMRLSHGFVRGEALSCIYHGWRYGKSGRCLAIPAHPGLEPPEAIRVAIYRTEERDGIIWVTESEDAGDAPAHDGFVGLRSVTIAGTPETLALQFDGTIAGTAARLLTAPSGEAGMTLVHLLVPATATDPQKIAASRALEALRRQTETARTGDAA